MPFLRYEFPREQSRYGRAVAEAEARELARRAGSGDRAYGHLGTIGTRSEVVEYRPEHYMESHGQAIAGLRSG